MDLRIWGSFGDASVLIGCGHRCRPLVTETEYMRRYTDGAVERPFSAASSKRRLGSDLTKLNHGRRMWLSIDFSVRGKAVDYRTR